MKNESLTRLREEMKWTKSELSRQAAVAWRTVDRAEAGLPIARISKVKIASALNVPVEKVFG